MELAPPAAALPRRILDILDLPFELAHALRRGLTDLASLLQVTLRMRGVPESQGGLGVRFPVDMGRALLEAAGLQADLVAPLWDCLLYTSPSPRD
eukprot:5868275-Alexandrium_andersonii.AAC.1